MNMSKWEIVWDKFELFVKPPGLLVPHIKSRLRLGAREYGDDSFRKSIEELCGELRQECLDFYGWGVMLFSRLEKTKQKNHYRAACRHIDAAIAHLEKLQKI